jgi:UDP-N-acetylmuramoyl-tripeptide--D-alanyl-D-alanine ligase
LAAHNRDVADPVVIAITGSTGKTSTKDLLASVVSQRYEIVASERSFNTETGVPLTLMRAGRGTDVLICEMGAQRTGEIKALCDFARPHVGVITNVGVAHIGRFGSTEAIQEAKTELVVSLPAGGSAVLNADDPRVAGMSEATDANVVTFGRAAGADVRAGGIEIDSRGRPSFDLSGAGGRGRVSLRSSGVHQVHNALAAAAAAVAMGMSIPECIAGLEQAAGSPWRMEVSEASGILLVNDVWNSNPASVKSALETCVAMKRKGRFVAVLGYMAELGDLEGASHLEVGEAAGETADRVVVVGEAARPIADGAEKAGVAEVIVAADIDEATASLADLTDGDMVLFKGSRVARLERLAAWAQEKYGA